MRQIAAAIAAALNILITGSIGSRFAIEGTLLKVDGGTGMNEKWGADVSSAHPAPRDGFSAKTVERTRRPLPPFESRRGPAGLR